MGKVQRFVAPGDRVRVVGCYSEALMHFGLAGRPVEIESLRREYDGGRAVHHAAQVYKDGRPFSGPITPGEAGFSYDYDRSEYDAYDDHGPGDADPPAVIRAARQLLDDAIAASGVVVVVITDLGLG